MAETAQPIKPTPLVQPAQPGAPAAASVPQSTKQPFPKKRRGWIMAVLGIFLLLALFYLANTVVPRVLLYFSQASNAPGEFSLGNSYVFGSPLVAQANGQDKIRVTAFLLDDKGRGVPGRQIELAVKAKKGGESVLPQIKAVQALSDNFGRVVFELVSTVEGQFVAAASISGLEFPQAVTLTFR